MISIVVTPAAYTAIAATVDNPRPPVSADGPVAGVKLWLGDSELVALQRARQPGESYSDAILRLMAFATT